MEKNVFTELLSPVILAFSIRVMHDRLRQVPRIHVFLKIFSKLEPSKYLIHAAALFGLSRSIFRKTQCVTIQITTL